jgi:hypothetical protein
MVPMLISFWRGLLLVLAAAATILGAYSLARPQEQGDFGIGQRPDLTHNGSFVVHTVTGEAARAGIRPGDTIAVPAGDRFRCEIFVLAGARCSFAVTREGRTKVIELTAAIATNQEPLWLRVLQAILQFSFLWLGGLIAWRWFDKPAARALACMLVSFGCTMSLSGHDFPNHGIEVPIVDLQQLFFIAGSASAVYFATLFPDRSEGLLTMLRGLTLPIALATIALSWIQVVGRSTPASQIALVLCLAYFVFATVVGLAISFAKSGGADRPRMLWVLASFATGFAGLAVGIVQQLNGRSDWASFALLAIPFGLTYAILRHRVFGVVFVINRAVVYAVVSAVVVAAFLIAEWLLSLAFSQYDRTANLIAELCVALALGFSIRFIHARVDRVVDDLFFRARHLAEAAIRRFAHEADLVTDADDLLDKTVDVVSRYGDASAVAVYLRRENGTYEPARSTFDETKPIGENDWALLEMRAWHQPVELPGMRSDLPGDSAFPLRVRGRLTGALVCAAKRSGESYAPDERDALRVLAHAVGQALDILEVEALRRELAGVLARAGSTGATPTAASSNP